MKRVTAFVISFLLLTPLVAYADLFIEPENDFYKQHQSRIIYLGRSFIANGEDDSVSVEREPGARNNVTTIQNGTTIYMQYSCLYDGDYWGFTIEYSGWTKLDEMLVLYDYVAFEEKHFDSIYRYSGDYAEIKKTRSAIAWPWPGSDAPLWTVEDLNTDNFRVAYAYTDADGREWGFVTYLYGGRNIWFCLSDPLNRDIPVFNPMPEPSVWGSETAHTDIRQYIDEQKNDLSIIIVIIVLVVVLVAGTAMLIRVFWNPKKN